MVNLNEAKHTPGPWHAEGNASVGFFMVKNEAGERVLNIRGGMIPTVHDARLIAAAPELLAALRQVVLILAATPETKTQKTAGRSYWTEAARAAITRASGESA